MLEPLVHTTSDKISTALAASAITSPIWLAWLKAISEIAALVAPILGACLLAVNLVAAVLKHVREARSS
ncbi:hypothetical protein C4587_00935 [Candidatus Parcubacteria bacterium]|nr:MAG: hypothetical protein C4587_00935 [Candidatus Parcubacteria bacterium]